MDFKMLWTRPSSVTPVALYADEDQWGTLDSNSMKREHSPTYPVI